VEWIETSPHLAQLIKIEKYLTKPCVGLDIIVISSLFITQSIYNPYSKAKNDEFHPQKLVYFVKNSNYTFIKNLAIKIYQNMILMIAMSKIIALKCSIFFISRICTII